MNNASSRFAAVFLPLTAIGCSLLRAGPEGSAPAPSAGPRVTDDLRVPLLRYAADRAGLLRSYDGPESPARRDRLLRFYTDWQTRLARTNFDALNQDGRIEYILLNNLLAYERRRIDTQRTRFHEMEPLIPFALPILEMHEARRRMQVVDPEASASVLTGLDKELSALRKRVEAGLDQKTDKSNKTTDQDKPAPTKPAEEPVEPLRAKKFVANRAAQTVDRLRKTLKAWFKHFDGYDPLFGWWVRAPYKKFDKSLEAYAKFLRERVVGIKKDDKDAIVGDPLGRDALLSELAFEMIPYTPEELIAIGEKEFAWCEAEMLRASRELGYGEDWHAALEHVKRDHLAPGQQPALIRTLALEAIEFLDAHDLVTVPPLAREIWRLEMMTPARQKVTPFFTGGEVISVAFPTDTMSHEQKLMSLRGNNIHFSRATVQHELIPGHHLQGFMTRRYKAYRRPFRTPFWGEGWALYWELRLWDMGFAKTPEDRIGMLFWRMHRCARIVFSLKFHLEQMTPDECIDMLVHRVGHELENAKAEVRRSFSGEYSPLYQCAYLIGGLQFRALHKELVESGPMTDRAFHDAILKEGSIPVEMVRAKLMNQPLVPDYVSRWRFYGDVDAGVDNP